MTYSIKRACEGDEQTLAYIQTQSWKQAFQNILSREELERCTEIQKVTAMYKKLLENHIGNGYILTVDGHPHCIAWWDTTREKEMPGYAELICIHSLQEHWRQGYGSKMMNRVISDITQAGYPKVMLWVFEQNTRARKFYEAKGFFPNGKTKPNLVPTEICYERTLCPTTK